MLCMIISCLCVCQAQARESEPAIRAKLQSLGQKLVSVAAQNVIPQKAKKLVQKEGANFVAHYVEIDTQSLRTELHPADINGHYVGLIKYQEHHYHCRASSKQAALSADCIRTRSRNLTEIIAYDGKWRY